MVDQDQKTRINTLRSNLRQVKYGVPVIAPALLWYGSAVKKWFSGRDAARQDEPSIQEYSRHEGYVGSLFERNSTDRKINVAVDTINYAVIGGLNHFSSGPLREEMVNTFRRVVALESGGKLTPEQVTFRDLKRSENVLVKVAVRHLERSLWQARLADLPFLLGALLPMAEEGWRGLRKRRNPESATADVQPEVRHIPSGLGTPIGLATSSIYSLVDLLSTQRSSYSHIVRLHDAVMNATGIEDDVDTIQKGLANVYNAHVAEAHEDAQRSKGLIARARRGVERLVGRVRGEKEPETPIFWDQAVLFSRDGRVTPEQLQISEAHPQTMGVMLYLAECIVRTHCRIYDNQGRRLKLGFDEALELMPWVNVQYPKITEYVFRIVAHGGIEKLERINHDLLEIRRQYGRGEVDATQRPAIEREYEKQLRVIYQDVIHEKLQEYPAVQDRIRVEVAGPGKETHHYYVDALLAAKLIGPDRMKSLIGLTDGADGDVGPNIGGDGKLFRLSLNDFNTLAGEIVERAVKEYDFKRTYVMLKKEQVEQIYNHVILDESGRPVLLSNRFSVMANPRNLPEKSDQQLKALGGEDAAGVGAETSEASAAAAVKTSRPVQDLIASIVRQAVAQTQPGASVPL